MERQGSVMGKEARDAEGNKLRGRWWPFVASHSHCRPDVNFDGAFLFDSGVCSRALPSLVAWQRRVSPDLMSSPNHLLFTQATLRTLRTPCIMLSVGTIGPVGKMDPVAWTEHPAYTREILRSRTERVRPLDMALCVCSIFAGISPAVRVTLYSGQDIVNSASQKLCHY